MRCPIPVEEFYASTGDTATALSFPPGAFTSPEFYEFELDAVWGHEWFCVGRATDIPKVGDYYTVTVGRDPLMVVRGADHKVYVRANVCQHRAMVMLQGAGNTRRVRCPYHSWVYGLDGQLQSAPDLNDAPCFDKSRIKLPEVRSEVWEGFVFITFDNDIPPLSERLGVLGKQLENWNMSELRSASPQEFRPFQHNWKLFGDECYHCAHLHARTWHQMYPTPSEVIDYKSPLNDHDRGIIAYELISDTEGASPTRTGRNLQPFLPGLTNEQRRRLVYVTVAPNLLIIAMPDKVKYFLWLSTGPTSSTFAATWMYPESTIALPGFDEVWQREVADLGVVMEEDTYAWSGVQQGMHSRFAPRGRYAPSEEVLVKLNEWLVGKYAAAERDPS